MHKGVPEASTQAVSLCLLGTHLRTSTHVHFFVYMCVFYMCVHVEECTLVLSDVQKQVCMCSVAGCVQ